MAGESSQGRTMKRGSKAYNSNVGLIHHSNELQQDSKHLEASRSSVLSLTAPSRLEEVTKQLNAIQKSLGSLTSGSIVIGERSETSNTEPNTTSTSTAAENEIEPSFLQERDDDTQFFGPTISLGTSSLERSVADQLVKHFEENYHRHCPIVDSTKSPVALYRSSPFLFWTIIIISCRYSPDNSQVYHVVLLEYEDLLGKTLIGPILDIETLQGLVLLCFWPLFVEKQGHDPTWNYCGLITNAALKMGLHRVDSDQAQSPTSSSLAKTRAKTRMAWLRLNSMHIWGPGLSVPSAILNEVRFLSQGASEVEKHFIAQTHVQRHSIKSAMLLSGSKGNSSLSLVHILVKDLDEIKTLHAESWDAELEILLLGVQVNIFAFQIQQLQLNEGGYDRSSRLELESSRKILLQQGFNASVRLIHTFSELCSPPNRTGSYEPTQPITSTALYLPKSYFALLMFARSFIFIFLVTNQEASKMDLEAAHNHIRLTRHMLSSWSSNPMDELGRAVRMIDVLSKAQSLSSLRLKTTRVNEQGSMDLLENVVLTAKEIRERSGGRMWSNFPISHLQQGISLSMQEYTSFDASETTVDAGIASGLGVAFEGLQEFDWDAPWEFSLQAPGLLSSDSLIGLDSGTQFQ